MAAKVRRVARHSSKFVVLAAVVGNLLVAATKFAASVLTGSSAMLSEGVHSLVDTGNELLLLYGMRRSTARPDRLHPLGYGRELYFWCFVVAILVFALGAGVSIYEGVARLADPAPVENPRLVYAVLAFSALFDGASWLIALRSFRAERPGVGLLQAVRESKDPPTFMVLFEDSAALIGLAVAFLGTFLSSSLERPEFDGAASILIGFVLAGTAFALARETKDLLIGEAADADAIAEILRVAEGVNGVDGANGALAVHLAPDQILVALSVEFSDALTAPQIEACVVEIERRVRDESPEVVTLFVKPQTGAGWRAAYERRFGGA
ncbi:cation diffusion facilitator family transporter [Methylocella sp.]|uniref:cation diffusion facilitator family transporter n=1 Tax=Methylocella sp. TaxID=1978226 RepID=UPI003784460D